MTFIGERIQIEESEWFGERMKWDRKGRSQVMILRFRLWITGMIKCLFSVRFDKLHSNAAFT